MMASRPLRLQPYDRGYRDGWHDTHVRHRRGRLRRRRQDVEYALGYDHGFEDGVRWPEYPEWWPDFARGSLRTTKGNALTTAQSSRSEGGATPDSSRGSRAA